MLLHIEEVEVELTCKVKKFVSCHRVGPSEQWGPAIDDGSRVEEEAAGPNLTVGQYDRKLVRSFEQYQPYSAGDQPLSVGRQPLVVRSATICRWSALTWLTSAAICWTVAFRFASQGGATLPPGLWEKIMAALYASAAPISMSTAPFGMPATIINYWLTWEVSECADRLTFGRQKTITVCSCIGDVN